MSYVLIGCRCLIGIVFLVSVAGKVRGRPAFEEFTGTTRTLLEALAGRYAQRGTARRAGYAVVAAEGAALVLLVPASTAWLGFAVATVLVTVFAVAIATALRRGVRAPCRCFGAASQTPLSVRHLVRNGLLIVVGVTGLAAQPGAPGTVRPAGAVIAAAAALVLAVLIVRLDDIVDLFSVSPNARTGERR